MGQGIDAVGSAKDMIHEFTTAYNSEHASYIVEYSFKSIYLPDIYEEQCGYSRLCDLKNNKGINVRKIVRLV